MRMRLAPATGPRGGSGQGRRPLPAPATSAGHASPPGHAFPAGHASPAAAYILVDAPWGAVHVAATDHGIVAVELASETESFVENLAGRLGGAIVPDQPALPDRMRAILAQARVELAEYFEGRRRSFDVPLDLRFVSTWDRRVFAGAAGLAYGEVTSYGGLARRIGNPRAARAVGGALGRNPLSLFIPCHRIVAGDGSLGGYGGGHSGSAGMLAIKRTLLALEGVVIPARLSS